MKKVRFAGAEIGLACVPFESPAGRPELHVVPVPALQIRSKRVKKKVQFVGGIHQGLAVVRKRQRYQPAACEPTLDSAKHKPIAEFVAGL
jgi:hypothetical protein